MKKKLAAILAAMMLTGVGTAMAADRDVNISGELHYRYAHNTYEHQPNENGNRYRLLVDGTTQLNENWGAYARFAAEKVSNENLLKDFAGSGKDKVDIDRFGFIYTGDNGFNAKIGRQGLFWGGFGLAYSSDGGIGENKDIIDGVVMDTKAGQFDLRGVWGKQWNDDPADHTVYGLSASFAPAANWTLGLNYLKVTDFTNYWSIDGKYVAGPATWQFEWGKAGDGDAKDAKDAYALGVSYDLDEKNNVYLNYFRIGQSFSYTDFDSNTKGYYLGITHKLNKRTSINLEYDDRTAIDRSVNTDSTTTKLSVNHTF